MQKNIYENTKNFLKGLAIFFGILVVIILSSMTNHFVALKQLPEMFQIGFIILAAIVAGTAFSNLRTKERTMSYLSLPATTLEKLLAELLISTIVYFVVYVLAFYIFNFLMILFGESVDVRFKVEMVDIFSKKMLTTYHYVIIGQSILFAGAATFMKRPLLSTGFTIFVIGVIYVFYTMGIAYFLEQSNYKAFSSSIRGGAYIYLYEDNRIAKIELPYTSSLITGIKYLVYYALAPIFWLVAYLKLKEKQV